MALEEQLPSDVTDMETREISFLSCSSYQILPSLLFLLLFHSGWGGAVGVNPLRLGTSGYKLTDEPQSPLLFRRYTIKNISIQPWDIAPQMNSRR